MVNQAFEGSANDDSSVKRIFYRNCYNRRLSEKARNAISCILTFFLTKYCIYIAMQYIQIRLFVEKEMLLYSPPFQSGVRPSGPTSFPMDY